MFHFLQGFSSPLFSHFAPQYKRKSTEGVSYFLFALVILGNTMYGLSVLLKNPDDGHGERSYMVHHLPWLVGSLGTLTLDLVVSFQTREDMASAVPLTCYILADAEVACGWEHNMWYRIAKHCWETRLCQTSHILQNSLC